MEPRVKVVNRNIARSRNCRCKYNNPKDFDFLLVNINYNGKISSYYIESEYLSSSKDSIHFYPEINEDGQLSISWSRDVEGHMKKVR